MRPAKRVKRIIVSSGALLFRQVCTPLYALPARWMTGAQPFPRASSPPRPDVGLASWNNSCSEKRTTKFRAHPRHFAAQTTNADTIDDDPAATTMAGADGGKEQTGWRA